MRGSASVGRAGLGVVALLALLLGVSTARELSIGSEALLDADAAAARGDVATAIARARDAAEAAAPGSPYPRQGYAPARSARARGGGQEGRAGGDCGLQGAMRAAATATSASFVGAEAWRAPRRRRAPTGRRRRTAGTGRRKETPPVRCAQPRTPCGRLSRARTPLPLASSRSSPSEQPRSSAGSDASPTRRRASLRFGGNGVALLVTARRCAPLRRRLLPRLSRARPASRHAAARVRTKEARARPASFLPRRS